MDGMASSLGAGGLTDDSSPLAVHINGMPL